MSVRQFVMEDPVGILVVGIVVCIDVVTAESFRVVCRLLHPYARYDIVGILLKDASPMLKSFLGGRPRADRAWPTVVYMLFTVSTVVFLAISFMMF